MGATTFNAQGGFEYEAELNIYSSEELSNLKPGLLIRQENDKRPMYYLYGWVRLKAFPKNAWTIIPKCTIKAWNEYFNVSLKLSDLGNEKSEILIPLGANVNNKEFDLTIK